MKKTIIYLLFLAAFNCAAQKTSTTSFSIEIIQPDSFYLVERIETTTKKGQRPEVTIIPQLFKDTAQLSLFIENLKEEAKKADELSKKYATAAKILKGKADIIQKTAKANSLWATKPEKAKQ